MRVVLEEPVELYAEYSFMLGDDHEHLRPVRVAWIKDEAGGQIAGLQFLDGEGTVPPADMPTE